jgi:hypothetical protein
MRHNVVLECGEEFKAKSVTWLDGGWLSCRVEGEMLVRLPPRRVSAVESCPDGDNWILPPQVRGDDE